VFFKVEKGAEAKVSQRHLKILFIEVLNFEDKKGPQVKECNGF
jgi:hypothetical protein